MNTFLLLLLGIMEVALCYLTISRKSDTGEWKHARLLTNIGELVLYLVMVLFPGIDFSFRFKGLMFLLIIRLILSLIGKFIFRKNDGKAKKSSSKIFSAMIAVILFAMTLIPSYIFADYNGLPLSGPYKVAETKAILIDENRVETFEIDGSKREVPIYFYYPEDAASGEKFPVVFFSHGAFGYYQSNTSTYQELASNGYVVISMEHPYHSLFTRDTDGRMILTSREFMEGIQEINNTDENHQEMSSEWIKLRLDDANFAVDSVKEAATDKAATGNWFISDKEKTKVLTALSMIDTDKIGFMGHSLGGATAVSLAKERDDIDAVIDMDGTMLGEMDGFQDGCDIIADPTYTYSIPILSFDNQEHHDTIQICREQGIPYVNIVVIDNALQGYETYIAGTGHMNYTDLPLFSPFLAQFIGKMTVNDDTSGTGSVDSKACVEKMNELTLQFFNAFLKNEGQFHVEEGYNL